MIKAFICGSFHHQEFDDKDSTLSPYSTPKRSKRSGSYKKSKQNKNLYANRGLDKFHALLSELEDKKQEIYTQKGAEDISVVQFAYASDNTIKPIVVKVKEKNPPDVDNVKEKMKAMEKQTMEASNGGNGVQESSPEIEKRSKKETSSAASTWDYYFKIENFRKPSYYLPMIVIVILLLLTMFSRSFAILCTSIGWYMIPMIKGGSSSTSRRRKRKKENTRKLNEKRVVNYDGSSSPRSVINGPVDHHMSPRNQGHKRSW